MTESNDHSNQQMIKRMDVQGLSKIYKRCDYFKPRSIVKHVYDYAVVHGYRDDIVVYTHRDTIRECISLCIEWKNCGHCTAGDIDALFLNGLIEFDPKPNEALPELIERLMKQ